MHQDNFYSVTPFITIYSLAHLIVDAACAFLLLGVLELDENLVLSMLIYNLFAFVLQAPFGYLIDKTFNPKLAAILGLYFVAISFLFWSNIYIALALAGIGNALFHVGGGSLVLSLKEKRATFSGIYVAPGGVGLAIGTFLSISYLEVNQLIFPSILFLLGLIIIFVKTPVFIRSDKKGIADYNVLIIALIMIPIAVRSLIGLSIDFAWKENQYLLLVLIVALALGKVFGGIFTDKYGLIKVGVGGLLISAPLLAFYSTVPILGILGAFVLNFTMPVTLIAIFNTIPDNKGLAFGLTTVALFIGSVPIILGRILWLENDWIVFSFLLLASIILLTALKFKDIFKTSKA